MRRPQPSRVPGCPPMSAHGLGTLMRTWAPDEPATQQDEDDEFLLEEDEDPSGWFVSLAASGRPYYWHRSSRRSVWHFPLGASSRRRRRGEEDQVDSLLRSSSTPAVAYAGLVWLVASRALFPVIVCRPEMLRIMAGMHQKDSCSRCTGKLDYLGDDFTMFPYDRNAWTSVLHALRQPTVLRLFSTAPLSDSHLFDVVLEYRILDFSWRRLLKCSCPLQPQTFLFLVVVTSVLWSRTLTFQFLVVVTVEGFTVLPQEQVPHSVLRRTWTSQFLVVEIAEIPEVFTPVRAHQRFTVQNIILFVSFLNKVQQRIVEQIFTRFLERQWGGRGCAYGDGCAFAHSWAELHPEASAHERELASYFDA